MQSKISEQYFLLAENTGNRSAIMRGIRRRAYLTACILFDMQLGQLVKFSNNCIEVIAPLPREYAFLNPVVDSIDDRISKTAKNSLRHLILNRQINRAVYDGVGKRLLAKNQVTKTTSRGLLFSHDKYDPTPEAQQRVIQHIRETFLNQQQPSAEIVALVSSLSRTRILKDYFDKSELAAIKERLAVLRADAGYNDFFKFAKWIDEFITTIILAASSHG